MEAKPGAKLYTYWANLIRVVSIYLVVMIHLSGQLTNALGKYPVTGGSSPISTVRWHAHLLTLRSGAYNLNSFIDYPLWSVPLVTSIVFLVSFLIVRGLQKIPVIKLIVP